MAMTPVPLAQAGRVLFMRHEDVMEVLNDPLAQELVHSPLLARMAYNGLDGTPRAIPIGYIWNGDGFVMCTASIAPKVRALQANPKAALTIDTDTQPPHILLVRGTTSVEIVDGVPIEYLQASWKSITGEEQRATFETQVRSLYRQMARITLKPEWAKLMDFETRLPIAVQHLVSGER
jgi:hypothetical protein